MIIWISGAYGVGKSTLAEKLLGRIDNSMIFDAEEVGNAVRENYPGEPYGVIYEDYPLWCDFNYMLLKDIHSSFSKNIFVPMTLVRKNSYSKIIERLNNSEIDTKLIVLEASHKNIHDRILARGEDENCWCMENIEMSQNGSKSLPNGFHINTNEKSVDEIADIVLAYLNI
ncbi:MAG: hypothetical protein IKL18_03665 [Oscillospiraceae bacterium]|nr:hypothetical protein [Oscillospiraceae bacterium]MBR6657250.1 hypothetical protein [Oscillospiraceae bacterium]